MAFPWTSLIGGASNLLGAAQSQKITASNNARDVAIAQANASASLNQTAQFTKMMPLAIGSIGAILVLVLVLKK